MPFPYQTQGYQILTALHHHHFQAPSAHLQHQGAVEGHGHGQTMSHVVELAPKATAFIEITGQYPGSTAIGWELQPVDGFKDGLCDISADPGLSQHKASLPGKCI